MMLPSTLDPTPMHMSPGSDEGPLSALARIFAGSYAALSSSILAMPHRMSFRARVKYTPQCSACTLATSNSKGVDAILRYSVAAQSWLPENHFSAGLFQILEVNTQGLSAVAKKIALIAYYMTVKQHAYANMVGSYVCCT